MCLPGLRVIEMLTFLYRRYILINESQKGGIRAHPIDRTHAVGGRLGDRSEFRTVADPQGGRPGGCQTRLVSDCIKPPCLLLSPRSAGARRLNLLWARAGPRRASGHVSILESPFRDKPRSHETCSFSARCAPRPCSGRARHARRSSAEFGLASARRARARCRGVREDRLAGRGFALNRLLDLYVLPRSEDVEVVLRQGDRLGSGANRGPEP